MRTAAWFVIGAGLSLAGSVMGQSVRLGEVAGNNPRYLQVADSASLRPANITLEAWVHPIGAGYGNTDGGAFLVGRPAQGTSGNFLVSWGLYYVVSTGRFYFEMAGPVFASNGQGITSNASVPLGGTAHVAATYDGQTLKLFVNGALDNQVAAAYPAFNYSRPDNVTIGAANYGFDYWRRFDGTMDEVRIWNTARTEVQISAARNIHLCAGTPGLVGYWTFTGNSLLDASGNGNNATAITAVSFPAEIAAISTCYANCDCSVTVPVLNVNDFSCFLNKFAAGDVYANCDNSTAPPVLNVNDFQCFLNAFAAGCS